MKRSQLKDKVLKRKRRQKHIWKKIKKDILEVPRLVIRKSNKNVYLTLMDDRNLKVLTGVRKPLKDASDAGAEIAQRAKKLGIEEIVFDRAGYKYHGIVKKVCDAARKGGLKF
ncbi:MAG: 50S ribosomal protein L18 [Elusimicrobia bacterium]|nr:50S ribosomal protein L18 [Elusimicrobiota bacterium]